MAITVTDIVAGPYVATGDAQELDFNFKVFTSSEIEVWTGADSPGSVVDPDLYSVTINQAIDGQIQEGGSVLLDAGAVASGASLRLIAKPDVTQEQSYSDTGSRLKNLNELGDRAALRDLRLSLDLSMGVTGAGAAAARAEEAADASEAAAVVAQAATASKANRNASDLTLSNGVSFRNKVGLSWVSPIEKGGKGNGSDDDFTALDLWAIDPNPYKCLPFGQWNTSQPFVVPRQDGLVIAGESWSKSVIYYTGADTTADVLTIGDGVDDSRYMSLADFNVRTGTTMTAGAMIRLVNPSEGKLRDVVPGGVFGDRGKVWDGIHYDGCHVMQHAGVRFQCQHDGVVVHGRPLAVNMWLDMGSSTYCGRYAVHCAGGMGGLWVNGVEMMGGKTANLAITEEKVSSYPSGQRGNREIFANSGSVSDGIRLDVANASDYCVYIDSPNAVQGTIQLNNWNAAAKIDGVHNVSWPNGTISAQSARNHFHGRHGFYNNDATTRWNINTIMELNGLVDASGMGFFSNVAMPVGSVIFNGMAVSNVAANFNSNANVGTWTGYPPVAVPQTGAFGAGVTSAGRFKKIDQRTVTVSAIATIPTNSTGSGALLISLPSGLAPVSDTSVAVVDRSTGVIGTAFIYAGNPFAVIYGASFGYPVVNGSSISFSLTYETGAS